MRILYVANHNAGGNRDERAIAFALRKLGHTVTLKSETDELPELATVEADLMLCHHWKKCELISRLNMKKVFWCFDLVDLPGDVKTRYRSERRKRWITEITGRVDLGFLSDGDWAKSHNKLVHLFQGADEQCMQMKYQTRPRGILFTGSQQGGAKRFNFVREMIEKYPEFNHVKGRLFQKRLGEHIDLYKIVVAPDSPVTDLYWSNRVYTALGFGALLVHPYCALLAEQYKEGEEIVFYRGRDDLHEKIDHYLKHPEDGEPIRAAGYQRTLSEHLYRHRCEKLIKTCEERIL